MWTIWIVWYFVFLDFYQAQFQLEIEVKIELIYLIQILRTVKKANFDIV